MKKTLLILAGIALLGFLLIARLFWKQNDSMTDERAWFVAGVRYEFSARVDSIKMLNENTGRLWCSVTNGNPQSQREDSLKLLFKEHDMLYLVFHHVGDSIIFLVPNAKSLRKGDSVRVSSTNNAIQFFRNGNQIASDQLTSTLTGYGRPFFMKWKKK